MAIEFVLDPYNIDEVHFDLVVLQDRFSIQDARVRIIENLTSDAINQLRLRFTHESILNLFSDYFGIKGVVVTFTPYPRALVIDVIKENLPDWISDDILINTKILDIIKNNENVSLQGIYKDILGFKYESCTFSNFVTLYYNKFNIFKVALNSSDGVLFVFNFIRNEISLDYFKYFIDELNRQEDGKCYLKNLAFASQIEKIRQYSDLYGYSVALPPMPISSRFASEVCFVLDNQVSPSLSLALFKLFNQVLDVTITENNSEALDDFPLLPVDEFYEKVVDLLANNFISLMTVFIENNLSKFPERYHNRLNNLLICHSIDHLPLDSNIESTLSWVENYFNLLKANWEDNMQIQQGLETEFSDWYLQNEVRVSRSLNNWTSISTSIQQSLKDGEVVVVYMVDALSAVHLDEVAQLITDKLPKCHVNSRYCFAPTPTLTEVGKLAVLTGRKPFSSCKDHEQAVISAYKDFGLNDQTITVHKSWQHRSPARLNENTQLYLYLENRIDEGLHDRKQYEDFSVYKQFVNFTVVNIAKHALDAYLAAKRWSKKIKFIITADHGVTKSSNLIESLLDNKKERLIYDFQGMDVPDSLYKVVTEYPTLGTCLIPKNRDSFHEVAFSHGGLTPEEVVIPWIEVLSNDPKLIPFILKYNNISCHNIGDMRWSISLEAVKNVADNELSFSVESPFSIIGNGSGNWSEDNHELLLSLTSHIEHQGLLEIVLNVKYKKMHFETLYLEVNFPTALIKRDKATSDFDDMLGL